MNAVALYETFRGEIEGRSDLGNLLPSHISRDRFLATALVAARRMPQLLACDRRSLHQAVEKAAYDGLLPDGREGVIVPRKEGGKLVAGWQPMTYGIRKRAAELAGIVIDAQAVFENDAFDVQLGDDPRILHTIDVRRPRGDLIAAYAIFRRGDEVLHREIMDSSQIARVRSISRQQDGLMWSKFAEEAWRKTVVRRGAKSVPAMLADRLGEIVTRDDDLVEIDDDAAPAPVAPKLSVVPLAEDDVPPIGDADVVSDHTPDDGDTFPGDLPSQDDAPADERGEISMEDGAAFIRDALRAIRGVSNASAFEELRKRLDATIPRLAPIQRKALAKPFDDLARRFAAAPRKSNPGAAA